MAKKNLQVSENRIWHVIWDFLTRPDAVIQDIGQRRQAQLFAGLSFLLSLVILAGLIASRAMNGPQEGKTSQYALLGLLAFTLVGYFFSRTRFYTAGTTLVLVAFSALSYTGALTGATDPVGFALTFLPLAFIISSALLSTRGIFTLVLVNTLLLVLLKIFTNVTAQFVWTIFGQVVAYGGLLAIFTATRNATERDRLAQTTEMNQKLRTLSTSLEQRVAERTRDILIAAEIGQRISLMQNLEELLPQAVELIRERFNLYYTQVYLVNSTGRSLLMRAGTGEAGEQLSRLGHRLPVDPGSVNGTAVVKRQAVVIPDTKHSLIHRPNALLPQTRSEMAIPLIAGDRVLGVLDLQSSEIGGLTEDSLPVFQTMAGQLATSLANAELFERIENALVEVEARNRQVVRQGWDEYQDAIHESARIGYVFDQVDVQPMDQPLAAVPDDRALRASINVGGEAVGEFQLVADRAWASEDVETIHAVAVQVAQQVENLRLLDQAKRYRSEAEEAVRRMTHQEWGAYMRSVENSAAGFVYAQDRVQPLQDSQDCTGERVQYDIRIRDEQIGQFGLGGIEELSPEDEELVAAVSEQLGAHLENMRLYSTAQTELEERRKAEALVVERAADLTTVAEVATVVSTIQTPEEMLQTVVDLTKLRFGWYHTHIYLLNEAGDTLVLTRGAGEVGRQMTAAGRQIPLRAEKSLVARSARERQGVIVNDVRLDPDFLPNPYLPDTRSEMAVPLIVGERLLGVLDIQSDVAGQFNDEDVSVQTTLASQVAVALQNASQFAQTQESEKLIRTVIDSTPDWIFIKDQQHRYRLVNQGYANSLHIPVESFVGKNDLELGFPEDLVKGNPEKGIAGFWADDRAVMDGGVPKIIPKDIVMIDGKERTFNTIKTPLTDADGHVWGVLAFGRDVTEREELLANTEESGRLIRTVIDSTPDWIFIKDQQHRYRLVNQGYANALGIPVEDFIGKNDLEMGFPEDYVKGNPEKGIRGFWADDRRVMDGDKPVLYPDDVNEYDGTKHIFNTLKTPLRDANGSVWGVLAYCRDVTEREQILADTEALYNATSQMARARSYDEILKIVVDNSVLKTFDSASIYFFDRPWNEAPETLTVLSSWGQEQGRDALPVGQPVPIRFLPEIEVSASQPYLLIRDALNDPRLDEKVRSMFKQDNRLAMASLQLKVGDQWMGCLSGTCSKTIDIDEVDFRRLITLVEQANTVIRSLQLFEAVQARAQREHIIREITARVRSSMDPDTILRTAVRELGTALGRSAFVRLGSEDQLAQRSKEADPASPDGNAASGMNGRGGK